MRLKDMAMIAADTPRSKIYLQALIQTDIYPSFVILMKENRGQLLPGQIDNCKVERSAKRANLKKKEMLGITYDIRESIEDIVKNSNISFMRIDQTDINSDEVFQAIFLRAESIFIYSGYGGQILREEFFGTGKMFLHVHGGYLPDYRGSTTNYYSLIKDNECGASSLFLNEKIDCGEILIRRKFSPPEDKGQMDYIYDPVIRAKVLVETIKFYIKSGNWNTGNNNDQDGETYFIMHPFLRHVAVLVD